MKLLAALCLVLGAAGSALGQTVSGNLRYTQNTGSTAPIRWARVELLHDDGSSLNLFGTTDGSGNFSISASLGSTTIRVRAYSEYPGVMKVKNSSSASYTAVSGSSFTANASISYTYPYSGFETWAAAMFLLDKMHSSRQHTLNMMAAIGSTDSLAGVDTTWPASSTYYIGNAIYISSGNEWDDGFIYHEFGHHVMACLSYISSPGGSHYLSGIYDLRLAWAEGWANYFVNSIRNTAVTIWSTDVANPAAWYPKSPGNEIRIPAVLWSVKNAAIGGDNRIWKTLDAMEYPAGRDIVAFYKKWIELGYDPRVTTYFDPHGVQVTPSVAPYSTSFDSDYVSGQGVSYYWTPGWSRHQTDYVPWGVTWRGDNAPRSAHSGPSSMNYNNDTNYDTGGPNYGYVESPEIQISAVTNPAVYFWCLYQTDTDGVATDTRRIQVSNDNFQSMLLNFQFSAAQGCGVMDNWHEHVITLDPSWGTVRIRFVFDTIDGNNNGFAGWFIDDFEVKTGPTSRPPLVSNPSQHKTDESVISIGATVSDSTIRFRATCTSPDNVMVKLQVEVRAVGTALSGSPTQEGGITGSGALSVDVSLSNGQYHWQTRTVDAYGFASSWMTFGSNPESEPDVVVDAPAQAASSGGGGGGGGGGGCAIRGVGGDCWHPPFGVIVMLGIVAAAGLVNLRRVQKQRN